MLIFADYWPITEFPAILKSEMQDTSFFQTTIVLGSQQLAKNCVILPIFNPFLKEILYLLHKEMKRNTKFNHFNKFINLIFDNCHYDNIA